VEDGKLVLQRACALGLEGIVSKTSRSVYVSGRGKSWVKAKCSAKQEFVIAGYVPSSTGRKAIGSLALGVYEGADLRHVGRVGTGFSSGVAEALFTRLDAMRVRSSPFAKKLTTAEARQVRFVRPELIAEVDFRGWTGDGLLRQASFQGLRDDKPAREVVRETTMATNAAPERPKSSVTLSHPDRVYWPDEGVTKEGLADYYAEAWPFMKPLIVDRALALVRCPDGIGGQTFFQKHAWKGLNRNIVLVNDPAEPEPLISIRDFDGLMALVQSAALEIHPWGSTVTDWEHPDMIVMDLDPGDDVDWPLVIAAAEEVRERLKKAGLASFVKNSGGKGLHVVSPIKPKADWPAVKAFTKAMADSMAADSPERFVSTIPKARRHGKILIDYLRNQRGMTAVSAYSTRARPGAAVSMPLAWEELSPEVGPAYFTTRNAPARLSSVADPWADFRAAAAPIEEERKTAKFTRKR
jgi:bifunctional non-homologous end joining protein LigD